jgi:hypothetical protein
MHKHAHTQNTKDAKAFAHLGRVTPIFSRPDSQINQPNACIAFLHAQLLTHTHKVLHTAKERSDSFFHVWRRIFTHISGEKNREEASGRNARGSRRPGKPRAFGWKGSWEASSTPNLSDILLEALQLGIQSQLLISCPLFPCPLA